MPRIIETTVYTIDELSDAAKENARIWYRQLGLHDGWYDFVYEDFETICRILGVTLATTPVRLYGGGTRDKPHIFFRGIIYQSAILASTRAANLARIARKPAVERVGPATRAGPIGDRSPVCLAGQARSCRNRCAWSMAISAA